MVTVISPQQCPCRNEAARRADDAVHRTAGQANKGIDKTYNTRHDYHREADSARKVQEKGEGAVDSAKDAAVQAKCVQMSAYVCLLTST